MEERIYVDVQTAADAMGKTVQWVRKLIAKGEIAAEAIEGSVGRGGVSYRIPVEALPVEAQLRYYRGLEPGGDAGDAVIADYKARQGEEGLKQLLMRRETVLTIKGMRAAAPGMFQDKAREYAKATGIGLRTIYRWEKAYDAMGITGLMRPVRADSGKSRAMCAEARRYVIEQYLTPVRRTQNAVLRNVRERAREMGCGACEECPYREGSINRDGLRTEELAHYPACDRAGGGIIAPDSKDAVNRVIASLTEEEKRYMRVGRKAWEAGFAFKNIREKPGMANLVWFGDHHQLDLFCIDENGEAVRPWLTGWYDAGTGCLVGWCFSTNPNSTTISEAFVRAAAYNPKHSHFWGLPKIIYVDNGKDYRSERLEGARIVERDIGTIDADMDGKEIMAVCNVQVAHYSGTESLYETLQVDAKHAKPYHGWAKPIERFFLTLKGYLKELPGYCGGKPSERPENFGRTLKTLMERGELLTMDEVVQKVTQEILPAYHNKPHDGYDGETPMARYARLPKARSEQPGWEVLAIAKEEMKQGCKVTSRGIRFRNKLYWDPCLFGHIDDRVTIRYNREDESIIIAYTEAEPGKPSRYIGALGLKETLKMVGEDADKLARYASMQAIQERELRRGIAAKGVKLPGKRASGHIYYEDIDMDVARGNITSIEAKRAAEDRRRLEAGKPVGQGQETTGPDIYRMQLLAEYETRYTQNGVG